MKPCRSKLVNLKNALKMPSMTVEVFEFLNQNSSRNFAKKYKK